MCESSNFNYNSSKVSAQAVWILLQWWQTYFCDCEDAGGSGRNGLALALPQSEQQPFRKVVLKTVYQYCLSAHITSAVCLPLQALTAAIPLSWLQHALLTDLFSVSVAHFVNASSPGFKKTGPNSTYWPWQRNWQSLSSIFYLTLSWCGTFALEICPSLLAYQVANLCWGQGNT